MMEIDAIRKRMTDAERAARFWSNVNKAAGDDCWLWGGAVGKRDGYGRFTWVIDGKHKSVQAHRLAFYLHNGSWGNPVTMHGCDVRPCCNPQHLEAGSHRQNILDAHARNRRGVIDLRGEKNPRSKLTENDVLMARRRNEAGETILSIAKGFGVSPSAVRSSIKGRSWAHLGGGPDAS